MSSFETEKQLLISSLPNGKMWEGKNEETSYVNKYLNAFANGLLKYVKNPIDIQSNGLDLWNATEEQISLFEKLVRLPDNIFTTIPENLEDRIKLVAIKLFGLKVKNTTQIKSLLEFVFPVLQTTTFYVKNGIEEGGFPYILPFVLPVEDSAIYNNTIFVYLPTSLKGSGGFPYILPFVLPAENTVINQIEGIIKYIIPFDKKVVIHYLD